VTGTLYVTIPRSPDQAAADIHPGQQVQVKGQLYQPASAPYAGAFDFRAYLERRGIFAGLRAYDAKALKYLDRQPPALGIGQIRYQLAQLRQRIVAAQVKGLGSPKGELVSGIVLGRRAVSMPHDVQDAFIRAGLAHTLSASGFHVSLLLSVVIWMTRRLEAKSRLGIGVVVLISYVGLTGIQPSILRAALMGVGGLVGLVMQRRVKPFAALCGVAFLLLLLNPLWMGSLGFWLSFLATLGLLVTVSPLVKALDWLPPTIAALVAVPIAAVLWTLPLQIYAFGVVSPYSILLNIVATPLIIVITLGGMISALFSLVWLSAGSAIAFLLSYPTQALIFLVNLCNRLPGNSYAVGKILLLQMLLIYGLWGLSWLRPWWQHRRWLAGSLAVLIVAIPASYARATTVELTVLGQNAPTFLLRDRGRTLLLSDGNSATIRYDILPLLQQQGINYVDVAIAPRIAQGDVDGWQMLQEKAPARQIFTVQSFVTVDKATPQQLPLGQPAALDDAVVTVLQTDPVTLKLQLQDQTWLIASYFDWDSQNHLLDAQLVQDVDVLLWYGGNVQAKMLERLQPETAIAFGKMNAEMEMLMRDRNISTYWLQRDGAVRWTPTRQFYPLLESAESAN
jgi:competence protein ComEC